MLVDSVSKGGNMLLNVGPNGRGAWEPRALSVLSGVGDWMRLHERSVRACGPSVYVPPADCRYTQNGDRLYLHLFAWPMGHLHLPGLGDKVAYAQFLHDASEVQRVTVDPSAPGHTYLAGLPDNTLTLELPNHAPSPDIPVIELFLRD